jgi:hypothetical protein
MRTWSAFASLVVTILVVSVLPVRAQNQTGLGTFSLGTLAMPPTNCPAGASGTNEFAGGMQCYTGNTIACTGSDTITFSFGYATPSGTPQGTIVLLPGGGGQDAGPEQEKKFAAYYYGKGYQVVQLQWDTDWEDVNNGNPPGYTPNIEVAACRPATFLSYIYLNYYSPIQHELNTAGMCAQGFSAGSGALGYALAWYGAYKTASKTQYHLDKADLLSGPVFSDIEQGCVVPQASSPTVCSGSPSYCQLGGLAPWMDHPWYTDTGNNQGPLTSIRQWTGDPTCNNSNNQTTSGMSNTNWKDMSIVSGGSNPPVFNYPDTVVTGWLCASGYQGATMNNSAAQGWFFDDQVTAAPGLSLYAVEYCPVAEAVYGSATANGPVVTVVPGLAGSPDGFTAIENDMINSCQRH